MSLPFCPSVLSVCGTESVGDDSGTESVGDDHYHSAQPSHEPGLLCVIVSSCAHVCWSGVSMGGYESVCTFGWTCLYLCG
jgi:hypothetical protein